MVVVVDATVVGGMVVVGGTVVVVVGAAVVVVLGAAVVVVLRELAEVVVVDLGLVVVLVVVFFVVTVVADANVVVVEAGAVVDVVLAAGRGTVVVWCVSCLGGEADGTFLDPGANRKKAPTTTATTTAPDPSHTPIGRLRGPAAPNTNSS